MSKTQLTSSWSSVSVSIVVLVPSVMGMSMADADAGVVEELDSFVEHGFLVE